MIRNFRSTLTLMATTLRFTADTAAPALAFAVSNHREPPAARRTARCAAAHPSAQAPAMPVATTIRPSADRPVLA